jgi:hypothetical protein
VIVLQYLVAGVRRGAAQEEGLALVGAALVGGIVGGIIFGPLALLARRLREVPLVIAVWTPACAVMGVVALMLGSWLEQWPAVKEFSGTPTLVAAAVGAVVGTIAGIIYGWVKPRSANV